MFSCRTMFCRALILAVSVAMVGAARKPDAPETPDDAILEAIRLLEAKDYGAFLGRFVAPDDLKETLKTWTMQEFVAQFEEHRAGKLLEILHAIKGKPPTPTRVMFIHGIKGFPSDTIGFEKYGDHWFIKNR